LTVLLTSHSHKKILFWSEAFTSAA
jgi:hypothetical protein